MSHMNSGKSWFLYLLMALSTANARGMDGEAPPSRWPEYSAAGLFGSLEIVWSNRLGGEACDEVSFCDPADPDCEASTSTSRESRCGNHLELFFLDTEKDAELQGRGATGSAEADVTALGVGYRGIFPVLNHRGAFSLGGGLALYDSDFDSLPASTGAGFVDDGGLDFGLYGRVTFGYEIWRSCCDGGDTLQLQQSGVESFNTTRWFLEASYSYHVVDAKGFDLDFGQFSLGLRIYFGRHKVRETPGKD